MKPVSFNDLFSRRVRVAPSWLVGQKDKDIVWIACEIKRGEEGDAQEAVAHLNKAMAKKVISALQKWIAEIDRDRRRIK